MPREPAYCGTCWLSCSFCIFSFLLERLALTSSQMARTSSRILAVSPPSRTAESSGPEPGLDKRLRTAPIVPRIMRTASARLSQTESTVRIPSIAGEIPTYHTLGSASGSLGQGAGDGVGHEAAAQGEDRAALQGRSGVEQSIGDEAGHNGYQVRRGRSSSVRTVR